jgi:hypothetical protein
MITHTHAHKTHVSARESVLEELHGIKNNDNPEDPASVDLWLRILDMNLNDIKRGTVYEVAEAMNRSRVMSRGFRMMFLRANRYDPEAAATHIIQFLELKRSLFGQDKLVKKITLDDLEEEDVKNIEGGGLQISPFMDRSGRKIVILFPKLRRKTLTESEVRARFYIIISLLESEETQIHGIVVIYYDAAQMQTNHRASPQPGLLWNMPVNVAGIHFCFSYLTSYILVSLLVYRLPVKLRPKVRVHYGSPMECLYKLESFGIPREALQMSATNEPTIDSHTIWYKHRQQLESQGSATAESPSISIISPGPQDILFGRLKNNGGNILMRELILKMVDEHKASNKIRKTEITELVIDEIHKTGGRFLKQNEETGQWEEVSITEANRKIAHTFRNIRRPSRAKKSCFSVSSTTS